MRELIDDMFNFYSTAIGLTEEEFHNIFKFSYIIDSVVLIKAFDDSGNLIRLSIVDIDDNNKVVFSKEITNN